MIIFLQEQLQPRGKCQKEHPLLSKRLPHMQDMAQQLKHLGSFSLGQSYGIRLVKWGCNWGIDNINELKPEVSEAAQRAANCPVTLYRQSMQPSWQGALSARESLSKGVHQYWGIEECSRCGPFMPSMASSAFKTIFSPGSPRMRMALWLSGWLLPRRRGACIPAVLQELLGGELREGDVFWCVHITGLLEVSLDP